MKSLPVSCAVIIQGQRFLLARRPLHKSQGGRWEFPGGKLDGDETAAQCIVREIMEELNVSVAVIRELTSVEHVYPQQAIVLIPLLCKIIDGAMSPTEHTEVRWVTRADAAEMDLCDADRKLLPLLAAELP